MKFLKKLKSSNFWVSMISAGILIVEVVFDFEIKAEYLSQIILGLLGILTVFGIVSDHGNTETLISNNTNSTDSSKADTNEPISNIKSICDTISLLLNKVSINNEKDEKLEETVTEEIKEEIVENEQIEEDDIPTELDNKNLEEQAVNSKNEESLEEVKEEMKTCEEVKAEETAGINVQEVNTISIVN